jgi:tetratricopeptide (TPR) repeat protein
VGYQPPVPEIEVEESMPAFETTAVEQERSSSVPQPWPQEPPHTAAEPPVLQQMVSEIEQSLGSGFLPEAEPAKREPVPAAEVASGDQEFRSGTLDEFVSDLEASLGSDFLPEAPVEQAEMLVAQVQQQIRPAEVSASAAGASIAHADVPVARAAAASAMPMTSSPAPVSPPVVHHPPTPAGDAGTSAIEFGPGVDLAEMFGELKHELEEDATVVDEDPETHYNLGVAFREMGLLDEAIGEFQKVCQAAEHGRAFSQIMQTYTWLAQCFLDKGVPEAAIRWYEKALKLPSLDQETRTALHYELASSFENAGNKPAALSNFLEVYGSNIDYRDVGERIKALRP